MKAHWKRVATVVTLFGVMALSAQGLEAQQRGQARRGMQGDRAQLEQRVRQRFGEMIRMRLGLEEEQAAQLNEVMRGFMEQRMQLARDEEASRRRVEALILEGGDDEAQAAELVSRLIELREREVALFRSEQEALLEILTPLQLLQFHTMREQLNQRVRELRGQPQPGRRPRGGPPPEGHMGMPIG